MRFPASTLVLGLLLAGLPAVPAFGQQSASYRLEEHVLNLGGHPQGGTVLSSAGFRLTLDSLGEGAVRAGLSSASYRMDGSFASAYPPPGEVLGLRFTDEQTLAWDPEPSVGVYDLYRDGLGQVGSGGYGQCWLAGLTEETATDADPVPAGGGFFYLVVARNRLGEPGTKGTDGAGTERGGNACP